MKNLKLALKNQNISIVKLAEKFSVSRPTIYSWIKAFENMEYTSLPSNVVDYFNSFFDLGADANEESILDIVDDYSLKFYGPNDYMFGYVLSLCNNHFLKIKNYYSNVSLTGGHSVINFFWLKKILQYEQWANQIKPEIKVADIIDWAKKEIVKYDQHLIAEEMYKNFIYLFEADKKSIHCREFYIHEIFSKPILYQKLFELVQNKFSSLIFYYFSNDDENVVSYYKKNNADFVKYMLVEKHFNLDNSSNVVDFTEVVFKRKICCEETRKILVEYLKKYSSFGSFTKSNYIQTIYYVENLEKISSIIKEKYLPNGLEIRDFKKEAEKAIVDFGEEISGEVDITELNRFLLSNEINIPTKFSSLTLTKNKDGKMVDIITLYEPKSVFSMFVNVVGMKVDDYYTEERIEFYKSHLILDEYCLDFIFKNKLVNDFGSYLSSCSETILKNLNISDDTLTKEMVGAVNLLLNSLYIKNKEFQHAYIYSVCLNVISLIEKLLRYVYLTYVSKDTAANASILVYLNIRSKADFDKTMKDFDYDLYKFLGYYLCKNDNDVGHDLRNKFMHREKDSYKLASYNLALELYSLLLHIVNYIMRKSFDKNKEEKGVENA